MHIYDNYNYYYYNYIIIMTHNCKDMYSCQTFQQPTAAFVSD